LTSSGQTGSKGGDGALDLIDDSDDFLSRERAALGEDANQFSTPENNVPSLSVQNGYDDLLGDDESLRVNGHNEEMNQFQSSFPSIKTRNEVGTLLSAQQPPFKTTQCKARHTDKHLFPRAWPPAAP